MKQMVRGMKRRPMQSALGVAMMLGSACADEAPADEVFEPAALLGNSTADDSTCRPHDSHYLQTVMHYGRVIASSDAFAQCMDVAVRTGVNGIGPYKQCVGDPFFGVDVGTQIDRIVQAARSPNDVRMQCGDIGAWQAQAFPGEYGHSDAEVFTWTKWSLEGFDLLEQPLCSTGASPCRWAPEPWPWSPMAGTVWHEAMHTHGYLHGWNKGNDAAAFVQNKADCGYAPEVDFNFQTNTLPYIVGSCINEVANRSAQACGLPLEQRNRTKLGVAFADVISLNLIDGFDSNTCRAQGDNSVTWAEALPVEQKLVSVLPGQDLWGNDYRSFDLAPLADYKPCQHACEFDTKCLAYTYVPQGVQGDQPRCWLKNAFGNTSPAAGLVSGYWQIQ